MKNRDKRKKKKSKVWIVILVIVAIFGFIVVTGMKNAKKAAQDALSVTVTNAARGDLQETVTVNGTVEGKDTFRVYAPAAGTVDQVNFKAGDLVKAGDVLFTYDMEKLNDRLYQSKLQLEKSMISYESTLSDNSKNNGKVSEANTNLKVLEQQLKDYQDYLDKMLKEQSDIGKNQQKASTNLTREKSILSAQLAQTAEGSEEYMKLVKQISSIESQLDTVGDDTEYSEDLAKRIKETQKTIAELETYKAKMESQKTTGEASVLDNYDRRSLEIDKELANLNYQNIQKECEKAKDGITAEFDGVVTECALIGGSDVAAGSPAFTIERIDQMKVSAYAGKYVFEKMEIGQSVDVEISGKTYQGIVSHIDYMAQMSAEKKGTQVGFEVELVSVDSKVLLGSDAKMKIYTKKATDALMLPADVVNMDKEGDFVYVAENSVVVRKPVTCGISADGQVEITSGISEQDLVITKFGAMITEGMTVIVKNEQ
ncbi:MAG: HlyD family efflux transporter periplasmic adaptor subunit [Lachnospiraceae bacterium]|nr:HlyD family efflux transporter periplasmic adaptor subunit [Lachnospiraceae bacterium]